MNIDSTIGRAGVLKAPAGLPWRDRLVIVGGLCALTMLSWLYLVRMPMPGGSMAGMRMAMPMPYRPTIEGAWLTFVMWTVMMAAMMVPSMAPMVLMFARVCRGNDQAPSVKVWLFALGYLVVWTFFSAVATAGQLALQEAALLGDALEATPVVGGAVLVAAGVYQLTPLKDVCLVRCRSPLSFFMTSWRDGRLGAFRMGLGHGAFCVACCWLLMALLFVVGVMNLLWVAALSAFVLLEKAGPYRRPVAAASGLGMLAAGIWMIAGVVSQHA